MKAIQTKFLNPTEKRGSRVKAWDMDGNTVTIDYDHATEQGEPRFRRAAQVLCDKMQWSGRLVGGAVKDGYVFVFVD